MHNKKQPRKHGAEPIIRIYWVGSRVGPRQGVEEWGWYACKNREEERRRGGGVIWVRVVRVGEQDEEDKERWEVSGKEAGYISI